MSAKPVSSSRRWVAQTTAAPARARSLTSSLISSDPRVEIVGGLVKEKNLGCGHEGPGNGKTFDHTLGVEPNSPPTRLGEADILKQSIRPLGGLLPGHAVKTPEEGEILDS